MQERIISRKSHQESVYSRELHNKEVLTRGPPSQNSITPRAIKLPCSKNNRKETKQMYTSFQNIHIMKTKKF